jgi:hypothetical protein
MPDHTTRPAAPTEADLSRDLAADLDLCARAQGEMIRLVATGRGTIHLSPGIVLELATMAMHGLRRALAAEARAERLLGLLETYHWTERGMCVCCDRAALLCKPDVCELAAELEGRPHAD